VQQRFSSLRLAMKAMLHSHSSQNTDSKVSLFAFRKFLKTVGVAASIQVLSLMAQMDTIIMHTHVHARSLTSNFSQESHGLFDYLDHDKDGYRSWLALAASRKYKV
jgi:hypothetical protein